MDVLPTAPPSEPRSPVLTVEMAEGILADLIRQRRGMRSERVEQGLLEANRLAIVYWQGQLARARFRLGGR